uniref:Uncharacterized protein n=1 Tax=Triticum urartu TaxID=4572 RepID=A0A8R7PXG7_TRIUA
MCTFFNAGTSTNGSDVAGRLVAAHLTDPAAAQRRQAETDQIQTIIRLEITKDS